MLCFFDTVQTDVDHVELVTSPLNVTKRGTHDSKQRTSPREVARATPGSTQPLLELPLGTQDQNCHVSSVSQRCIP